MNKKQRSGAVSDALRRGGPMLTGVSRESLTFEPKDLADRSARCSQASAVRASRSSLQIRRCEREMLTGVSRESLTFEPTDLADRSARCSQASAVRASRLSLQRSDCDH